MATKISPLLKKLAPLLLTEGFKKKSGSFFRRNDHFWHVLNWQVSTDVTPGQIKFTVNVGVHDLRLAHIEGDHGGDPPDIWRCHYRTRLGNLLVDGADKWWLVPESGVEESIVQEFIELIRDVALPFFEQFKTIDGLLDMWRSGQSPGQTKTMRERYIALLSRP